MDSKIASHFEPEISSMDYALYDYIPPELVVKIDSYLSFDDSLHFQECSNYIKSALHSNWYHYDKIQISDDPADCYVISTKAGVPKRNFSETNLDKVFIACSKIAEVMMIMKDIGSLQWCNPEVSKSLKDTSLYHANGYLGYLFSKIPQQTVAQLKIVSLHVDIMRDNLSQLCFPCPTQDLLYSIHHLADSHFETFIQISFCSVTIQPEDYYPRTLLLRGMEMTLKSICKYCTKIDFTVDSIDGYADMTVEKDKLEYSFAFFYYNPQICEIESQSVVEGMDQTDNKQLINSSCTEQKPINNTSKNDNCNIDRNSSNSDSNSISCSIISNNNGISTSSLTRLNIGNQMNCQSEEGMCTSFLRNLMKTY